ncbi:hypothetical protein [Streptomyces sp. NPDC101455]|uniref:hypothetical protein n=1 Tax=Streptomyces sp. NPDC101455 TaxID=3366142 RepID=UPI0037FF310E
MARRRAILSRTTPTVALALMAPLALSACGSNSGSSGGADTLRVMDYYADQPDKGIYAKVLDACGQQNGVKIKREAVAGPSLIPRCCNRPRRAPCPTS